MMSFRAAIARRANPSVSAAAVAATAARHQSSTTAGGVGYVSFPKSTVSASSPTFARSGMTGSGHDQYKLSDVHYDGRRYAVRRSEFAAPDTSKVDLFTLNRHQLEPGVFDPTTAGGRPERAKNVKRAKSNELHRMWTPPRVAGVAATAFSQVKPMEDNYGYTRHSPFALKSKITTKEIKPAVVARKKAAAGAAAKRKSPTAARKKAKAAKVASPLFAQEADYAAWKNLNGPNAVDVAAAKKAEAAARKAQRAARRAYSPTAAAAAKRKQATQKSPALAFGPRAIRVERTASMLGLTPEEAATHRASITNTRGLRSLRAKAEAVARASPILSAKQQAKFDAVDAATSRAALREAGNASINAATKRTTKRMLGGKMPEAYSSSAYMRKQPEKYAAPTWGNVAANESSQAYTGASPYDTQTPESSTMFLGGAAIVGLGVLAMLYARDYRLHHPRSRDTVSRYGNRYMTEGDDAMMIEATAGGAAAANGRNATEPTTRIQAPLKRAPVAAAAKPAPPAKMVAPNEDAGAWGRVKHWADETADESVTKTHVGH